MVARRLLYAYLRRVGFYHSTCLFNLSINRNSMGTSNIKNLPSATLLDDNIIRYSGFTFKHSCSNEQRLERRNEQNQANMIVEKLTYPVISAIVVGAASSIQSSSIAENMSLIAALLGAAVTIALWGLGHLIGMSIKIGKIETKIEDMEKKLDDLSK